MDDLGATIFLQVVSARYDRGGIILTSNKSYGAWRSTPKLGFFWRRMTPVSSRVLNYSLTAGELRSN
jgi:hypothetical protein